MRRRCEGTRRDEVRQWFALRGGAARGEAAASGNHVGTTRESCGDEGGGGEGSGESDGDERRGGKGGGNGW